MILLEIRLSNVRKEIDPTTKQEIEKDHFKERRKERLYDVEPHLTWNSFLKTLPEELDRSEVQKEILDKIIEGVNENINKAASLDTTKYPGAIVLVGDIKIKRDGKIYPLLVHSNFGEGSYYYLPVIKDTASTLMLVPNNQSHEWRAAHFRSIKDKHKDVIINNEKEIPFYEITPQIIIDYDSLIKNLLSQKNKIQQERSFNRKDLPYKVLPDYRQMRAGKKTTLDINIPNEGLRKLPILSASATGDGIYNVTVDTGSMGNAMAYYMKLNNKVNNGFKPLKVTKDGSTITLYDIYSSLAFNNKDERIEIYESIKKYIILLEQLTNKKVTLE